MTEQLIINSNPEVDVVLNGYETYVRKKLLNLRRLILETADELEEVLQIEETLKWGEPSYLTKKGSTLRMDWKEKTPDQYAMYFKCTSKLVSTFKVIYPDVFRFEGDRAIVFHMDDKIPEKQLKRCIGAALTYHKVKHLPWLGL